MFLCSYAFGNTFLLSLELFLKFAESRNAQYKGKRIANQCILFPASLCGMSPKHQSMRTHWKNVTTRVLSLLNWFWFNRNPMANRVSCKLNLYIQIQECQSEHMNSWTVASQIHPGCASCRLHGIMSAIFMTSMVFLQANEERWPYTHLMVGGSNELSDQRKRGYGWEGVQYTDFGETSGCYAYRY